MTKDFDWEAFTKEKKEREEKAKKERERANESVRRGHNLGKKK